MAHRVVLWAFVATFTENTTKLTELGNTTHFKNYEILPDKEKKKKGNRLNHKYGHDIVMLSYKSEDASEV